MTGKRNFFDYDETNTFRVPGRPNVIEIESGDIIRKKLVPNSLVFDSPTTFGVALGNGG